MAFQITIGGVDRTKEIKRTNFKINDIINNRVDTCSFKIEKVSAGGYAPALNAEVIALLDGERIFGGNVSQCGVRTIGSTKAVTLDVKCVGFKHQFSKMLVTDRFEDMTANAIITALMADYGDGFTMANAAADVQIDSIAFNRIPLSDAINKLAGLINYSWYIDYNKDLHFFQKNSKTSAFNIADDSANYVFESLEVTKDISQIRNSIFVQGGEERGEPRIETYVVEEGQTTFPLANKFAEQPDVEVDGIAQTVGVDFKSEDADFEVQWNFNQTYIKFTDGNEPATDAEVTIEGIPLFPILVNVPSPVSIGEFGRFEFSIVDKTIKSRGQAVERALAELQAYGGQISEGSFRTHVGGLRSGQIININSDLRGIAEDFLIQKVSFSVINDVVEGDIVEKYLWEVDLATLKTVGIIAIMQRLLLQEELSEGEQESLLTYLEFADRAVISDSLDSIAGQPNDYVYDNPEGDLTGNTAEYGAASFG